MRLELALRREVEDERLGQPLSRVTAQLLNQPAAQLDATQRVEPRLHQRRVRVRRTAKHIAHDGAHSFRVGRCERRCRLRRRRRE